MYFRIFQKSCQRLKEETVRELLFNDFNERGITGHPVYAIIVLSRGATYSYLRGDASTTRNRKKKFRGTTIIRRLGNLPTSLEPPHVPSCAWRANRDNASTYTLDAAAAPGK